jgi:hypothetical protein
MVIQLVHVTCEIENLHSFVIPEDHEFIFDVELSSSEIRQNVKFTLLNEEEIPNSRGVANLIFKIDKNAYASIKAELLPKTVKRELNSDDSNREVAVLALDCRGCEVRAWKPTGFYRAVSAQGTVFDDVDLSTGEWYDVDPETNEPVSITNVRTSIDVYRK